MQPLAVNPSKMALLAKMTVARYFGFVYTASRYTFSPPLLGSIVPYSSQINKPQNDKIKPRIQSIIEAPTEPTERRIEDGVENIPVPMIRPTLEKH
jgi:hypothetical protein